MTVKGERMSTTPVKFALLGSIILLFISAFLAFFGLAFMYGDITLADPGLKDIDPLLFIGLAGLITSGLGIAGGLNLHRRPVLSRIFLAAVAFISLVWAVLTMLALALTPDGLQIFLLLLFFAPAALLTASFITSLSLNEAGGNNFV